MYKPKLEDFPTDKGAQDGHCNRSSCMQPGANWYNHSTRKWYCCRCAELINDANPEFKRDTGHSICTQGEEIDG